MSWLTPEVIYAILSTLGIGAGLQLILKSFVNRKQREISNADRLVDLAGDAAQSASSSYELEIEQLYRTVDRLTQRLDKAEQRIEDLREENSRLRHELHIKGQLESGIAILLTQMKSLGITPYWVPPGEEEIEDDG
jgi:predicted RNase H-like nuclease (RuvC/YqgF family)